MKKFGIVTMAFGCITLLGGLFGYIKANSLISMLCGLFFGVVLIVSGVGSLKKKRFFIYLSVIATLILDGFFTYRFLSSFAWMPAGLMTALCLLVLCLQLYWLRTAKN